jgi:hypothetical protein
MHIYQLVSRYSPEKRAFSSDPTGANLPADNAPWVLLSDCGGVSFEENDGPIARAVHRNGRFFIDRDWPAPRHRTLH